MHRLEATLRLALCRGIGPLRGKELLDRCGDPSELFATSPGALETRYGIPPRIATCLQDPALAQAARAELADAARHGFRLLALGTPEYPRLLAHAPASPLILWVWGELGSADEVALAVVGTRKSTAYGRRQAARFVRELAQYGIPIVSGLARGIDAVAHEEALRAGTRTIAVLGSGLARVYPPEHRPLAARIARCGAVLSEFPLHMPPHAHNFPRRNRIIAGLSIGVLVIEGSAQSGTMITARHAAEQGRVVFALPGPIDSPNAGGVNELLRDGAVLTTSVGDILGELSELAPFLQAGPRTPESPALTPREHAILLALPPGVVTPDAAAHALRRPLADILAALTTLALKGYLRRSGKVLEKLP